jgi:heme exporter protein D
MGVTGHFAWAAFGFVLAIVDALVLLAGVHYGKGTLRNVWRLANERAAHRALTQIEH